MPHLQREAAFFFLLLTAALALPLAHRGIRTTDAAIANRCTERYLDVLGVNTSKHPHADQVQQMQHLLIALCTERLLGTGAPSSSAEAMLQTTDDFLFCGETCQLYKQVAKCLFSEEESESAELLLQQQLQTAVKDTESGIKDYFLSLIESLVNSVLGALAGTKPQLLYEKAQCVLWTRNPAEDTVNPKDAYQSWETVQEATRFALLAYHQEATIKFLFSGCKEGHWHGLPLPKQEISTCAPSKMSYEALRYDRFYSEGKRDENDKCAEWWSKYELVRFFNNDDKATIHMGTEAIIAKETDGKTVWVAFRGSESPLSFDPSHIMDWLKDLSFYTKPWPYVYSSNTATDGRIHAGFLDQYNQIRSADAAIHELLHELHASGYTDFYFTGHSLGGALAQVGSFDFAKEAKASWKNAKTHMITLAAPEVFDTKLAAEHRELVQDATRIVYNTDVVTCGFGELGKVYQPLVKLANGGVSPYVDNTVGQLLYWSHRQKKWRGTRDYECFEPDWDFGSDFVSLAGALDHLCQGYLEKSYIRP